MALAWRVAGCLELKMAPPQNLCDSLARPRNGWHSVFHMVTRAACPPRSPGAKKAPAGACATNLSGRADPCALHNPDFYISQSPSFPHNQKQQKVDSLSPVASLPKQNFQPSNQQHLTKPANKITCANCKNPLQKEQTAYQ